MQNKYYKNILNENQKKMLYFLRNFNKKFGLVGGTAIALQIGHRESIDFDLFTNKEFKNLDIQKQFIKNKIKIERVFVDEKDEYTVVANGVKLTFLYYPFKIDFSEDFNKIIKMPNLLTIAALKSYALGRRSKWKDYIDLYFLILKYVSIEDIIKTAKNIFGDNFDEKIFRTQLCYFKDIDYSEKIVFKNNFNVSDKEVKECLKDLVLR